MGRADALYSGAQRMVTTGEVIYVHQVSRKPEPPPLVLAEPAPAAEPAPLEQPAPQEQPEREAPEEIIVRTGLETWTYTPAPPGYAHEFGTGRLVPVWSRSGSG